MLLLTAYSSPKKVWRLPRTTASTLVIMRRNCKCHHSRNAVMLLNSINTKCHPWLRKCKQLLLTRLNQDRAQASKSHTTRLIWKLKIKRSKAHHLYMKQRVRTQSQRPLDNRRKRLYKKRIRSKWKVITILRVKNSKDARLSYKKRKTL